MKKRSPKALKAVHVLRGRILIEVKNSWADSQIRLQGADGRLTAIVVPDPNTLACLYGALDNIKSAWHDMLAASGVDESKPVDE